MNTIKNSFFTLSLLLVFAATAVFAGTAAPNASPLAALLGNESAAASLTVDKKTYAAGDTVGISGEGFGGFEAVTLTVESYSRSMKQFVTVAELTAFADLKGRFNATLPFDSLSAENPSYTIRAFGSETKTVAQTVFSSNLGSIPASIRIIKDAQPNTATAFSFSASGQVTQNFSLTDNGVVGPDRILFSNLDGTANNVIRFTELTTAPGYSLVAINCTSTPHSVNFPAFNNNIINLQSRFVDVVLEDGEDVVCTFVNAVTTASSASVSGRTLTESGQALARTLVTIQNTATGETLTTYTNTFGRYQFDGLTVGDFYVISVYNRKYTFEPSTQGFTLNDAVEGLNFTAAAR